MYQKQILMEKLKEATASVLPISLIVMAISFVLVPVDAGLMLSFVIFGILSTFAAIVTEQIGEAILGILLPQSSTAYNVLLYFVVVALSEEGFKYLLLKKRTWYSSEFNCQFDGVVYAVFVALGFALWENISYVLMYGLGTAAVRAVTAVPGHACFGVH